MTFSIRNRGSSYIWGWFTTKSAEKSNFIRWVETKESGRFFEEKPKSILSVNKLFNFNLDWFWNAFIQIIAHWHKNQLQLFVLHIKRRKVRRRKLPKELKINTVIRGLSDLHFTSKLVYWNEKLHSWCLLRIYLFLRWLHSVDHTRKMFTSLALRYRTTSVPIPVGIVGITFSTLLSNCRLTLHSRYNKNRL